MKFAYADPPYPGQSADLYADQPDYAGEVDHAELIGRLCSDYPDGWALSTSARALRHVLPLCPQDVWTAAWHKTNAPPIRTTGRFIWSWEPVIIWRGRARAGGAAAVRDALSCAFRQAAGFPGQKPAAFTRWIVELLGAVPEDTIDDLFRGSGAVTAALAMFTAQPQLRFEQAALDGAGQVKRVRRYAGLPGSRSRRAF